MKRRPGMYDCRNLKDHVTMPQERQEELGHIAARMQQPEQWAAMREKIRQWAHDTGYERTDFFASNWKTGSDWYRFEDGLFVPLYLACDEDFKRAGHMFGWLVRSVMIEVAKDEDWLMYKNPEAGSPECPREFWGTFYWRRDRVEG